MLKPQNHILIIFGASGDLTRRKLIPAIFELYNQNLLPEKFAILGVGRSNFTDESFRNEMIEELKIEEKGSAIQESVYADFLKQIYYIFFNTKEIESYSPLKTKLEEISRVTDIPPNYIFYLATPPSLYEIIPEALAHLGLNSETDGIWRRIIIEKPFGYNLISAKRLNRQLLRFFHEDQIFRIDHYLGKETVQNIMVTRFSNGFFEPLWNHNFIHHVEITSAENIGVEARGGYYDSSGALRDMVQNHLLQLTAIMAMDPPAVNDPTAIRNETLKVFQALKPYNDSDIESNVIRGQYTASKIRGENMKGYREEPDVDPGSRTETFVALKLFIDNWRWAGVPFYIRTGKRLPTRVTEAVIHFKPSPHRIFCFDEGKINRNNQLVLRIQPDEGILLKFGMKIPGAGFRVQDVNMDFHYSDLSEQKLPEAYQRLLLDCMNGDATLYARGDAVDEAWKFIDPVLDYWKAHPENQLHGYPAGTWGPNVVDDLIEGKNLTWRYPCKNLTDDGIYCEL
jgi:glucose-6-phosphate 1-dehydrogenase